MKLFLTTEWH